MPFPPWFCDIEALCPDGYIAESNAYRIRAILDSVKISDLEIFSKRKDFSRYGQKVDNKYYAFLAIARYFEGKKTFDMAMSFYKLTFRDPPTINDQLTCSRCYFNQKMYDEAIDACQRGLSRESVAPRDEKSKLYLSVGRAYQGKGDHDQAFTAFDAGLKENPKDTSQLIIAKARLHQLKKQYAETIKLATDALKDASLKNEIRSELLMLRGRCYEEMGKLEDAGSDFKEMVKLQPNNTNAELTLLRWQQASGEALTPEDFIALQNKLRRWRDEKGENDYFDVTNALGRYYQSVGEYNLALKCYEDCGGLKPGNINLILSTIIVYAELADFEGGYKFIENSLPLVSDDNRLEFDLSCARLHQAQGDYKTALEILGFGIKKLTPTGKYKDSEQKKMHFKFLFAAAVCNEALEESVMAETFFVQCRKLYPNDQELKIAYASNLARMHKLPEALEIFEAMKGSEAIQNNTILNKILLSEGRAYEYNGQMEEAEKCYQKALEVSNNNFQTVECIIHFYKKTERYDKVVEIFETYPSDQPLPINLRLLQVDSYLSRQMMLEACQCYFECAKINPSHRLLLTKRVYLLDVVQRLSDANRKIFLRGIQGLEDKDRYLELIDPKALYHLVMTIDKPLGAKVTECISDFLECYIARLRVEPENRNKMQDKIHAFYKKQLTKKQWDIQDILVLAINFAGRAQSTAYIKDLYKIMQSSNLFSLQVCRSFLRNTLISEEGSQFLDEMYTDMRAWCTRERTDFNSLETLYKLGSEALKRGLKACPIPVSGPEPISVQVEQSTPLQVVPEPHMQPSLKSPRFFPAEPLLELVPPPYNSVHMYYQGMSFNAQRTLDKMRRFRDIGMSFDAIKATYYQLNAAERTEEIITLYMTAAVENGAFEEVESNYNYACAHNMRFNPYINSTTMRAAFFFDNYLLAKQVIQNVFEGGLIAYDIIAQCRCIASSQKDWGLIQEIENYVVERGLFLPPTLPPAASCCCL